MQACKAMSARFRVTLLAATAATVLAFGLLVLLDRPARALAGAPVLRRGRRPRHGAPAGSGFDGAALPASVRAHGLHAARTSPAGRCRSGATAARSWCSPSWTRACSALRSDRPADPRRPRRTGAPARGADRERRPARRHARSREPLPRAGVARRARSLPDRLRRQSCERCWRAYGAAPASSAHAHPRRRRRRAADRRAAASSGSLFGLEQLTPESLAHDIRRLQSEP